MDSFARMWTKKRPMMQVKGTLLHLGDARSHLAPETFGYHGIIKRLDLPDGQDLRPADFWNFGQIHTTLEARFLQAIVEIEEKIVPILRAIPLDT
jgi:hypothetical protein